MTNARNIACDNYAPIAKYMETYTTAHILAAPMQLGLNMSTHFMKTLHHIGNNRSELISHFNTVYEMSGTKNLRNIKPSASTYVVNLIGNFNVEFGDNIVVDLSFETVVPIMNPNMDNSLDRLLFIPINDYDYLTDFAHVCDKSMLHKLFIGLTRFGVLRDVEYLVQYVKAYLMHNTINEAIATAVKFGHDLIVNRLLNIAKTLYTNLDSAFINAVVGGNYELTKLLHRHGANIHLANGKLLYYSCLNADNDKIMQFLIDSGISVFQYYTDSIANCLANNYVRCQRILVTHSVGEVASTADLFYLDVQETNNISDDESIVIGNFDSDTIDDNNDNGNDNDNDNGNITNITDSSDGVISESIDNISIV